MSAFCFVFIVFRALNMLNKSSNLCVDIFIYGLFTNDCKDMIQHCVMFHLMLKLSVDLLLELNLSHRVVKWG